jgi:CHAT domain-containing protein
MPSVVWRRNDGSYVASLARTAADDVRVTDAREVARALGRTLVEPLEGALAGHPRLLVSPDGALALVPFEALSTARGRVLERYRVSYVQSLSVLALVADRAKDRTRLGARRELLAMGAARYDAPAPSALPTRGANVAVGQLAMLDATPGSTQRAYDSLGLAWRPLPGARREIDAVGRLFAAAPGDLYVDANATETRLRALDASGELARYRHLLFAAHGYLSTEAPALSALVLGRDAGRPGVRRLRHRRRVGRLPPRERPRRAVGVRHRRGPRHPGEGVMGLPFALFVAGNRNAVLSLWPVYDEGTAEFMRRFFARVHAGQAHADALAATKRELAASKRYGDPAHWAGFVLYGD